MVKPVYIVTLGTDYEGDEVAGIYEDLEAAKAWVVNAHHDQGDFSHYDEYSIHKREVGKEVVQYAPPLMTYQPDFSLKWQDRINKPWKWYNA